MSPFPLARVTPALQLCALLAVTACTSRETASPLTRDTTHGANAVVAPGDQRPAVVALQRAPGDTSVCPTSVRDIETGHEFMQARSDIERKALAPGQPLEVTRADAIYIRATSILNDTPQMDSLHVDCRTLQRLAGVPDAM